MADALNHIIDMTQEIAYIPAVIAGFLASLPLWVTALIGVNVAMAIATIVIKILLR